MNTLQNLNLSERDFQLIIDGLDALPERGAAGDMMGDLLIGMLTKDDSEAKIKIKSERQLAQAKKKKEKDLMIEDIKILQGKLLMLKRYLAENNALNETYDIINSIS